MHFDWYLDHPFLLDMYGRYFWYMEITRATQVIAAYAGDELAGILLADIRGEEKKHLTVNDLLQQFEKASGEQFANDQALLG